jgi:hypothetical protein
LREGTDERMHGLDSRETLRVEAYGSTFLVSINGRLIDWISDPDYASGEVGLFVETLDNPDAQIRFDSIVIWDMQPTVQTPNYGSREYCLNARDDDGDRLIDRFDPDCQRTPRTPTPLPQPTNISASQPTNTSIAPNTSIPQATTTSVAPNTSTPRPTNTPRPRTPTPRPSNTPRPRTPTPIPNTSTPIPNTPIPNTPIPNTPIPDTPIPDTPIPDTPIPNTPIPDTPIPDTPEPPPTEPEPTEPPAPTEPPTP